MLQLSSFQFKQFTIYQDQCSMKVTTDSCLFGAWAAADSSSTAISNILDIGAGTGLLSLMLAQKTPAAIDAVEIQEADFLQCASNIARSPYAESITAYHTSIQHFAPHTKYDIVISNPPFYDNDLTSNRAGKNIAHHSTHLSFDGLLQQIQLHLNDTGVFYLLIPAKRLQALQAAIIQQSLHVNHMVYLHQTNNHDAFRVIIKGGRTKKSIKEEKIIIKENNQYTTAFVQLLQPYYLYL